MPDLSNKSVHKFWYEHPDPSVYKVISFMESVENWTLDNEPELEKSLKELGDTLDNIGNIDLQEEDSFIKIASYIKMGQTLRLLQCMDTAHPGAAAKILIHAESESKSGKKFAGIFLKRNMIFERLRLLGKIFHEDRLNTIIKILGNGK